MPTPGTQVRHLAAKKAAQTRWSQPSPDLDRDLAAARLEDYVRRVVNAAPPLTAAQRDRLAVLLRGGGSGAA
jgi:hypothetical protein